MRPGTLFGVWSILAWFFFPIVPGLLGSTYHQTLNWSFGARGSPDPRDWGWGTWFLMTGPLLGYGFLAGATLDLPDDPSRRGVRRWFSNRSVWVAVGPWMGFLIWAGVYQVCQFVNQSLPTVRDWFSFSLPPGWQDTWIAWLLFLFLLLVPLAYGWLFVALASLRRARRYNRLRQSVARGFAVAAGFVGSLFGTFWAITEAWRSYFFDPRIMPALIAVGSLSFIAGCASTETYGEVRRRELFQAMLMAWLLGLALVWRWWSRSRSKPPGSSS